MAAGVGCTLSCVRAALSLMTSLVAQPGRPRARGTLDLRHARLLGHNAAGQTTIAHGIGHVARISAGDAHTCAIKVDHTPICCCGQDVLGQSKIPTGTGTVTQMPAAAPTRARSRPAVPPGHPYPGAQLIAEHGNRASHPASYSYRWQRCRPYCEYIGANDYRDRKLRPRARRATPAALDAPRRLGLLSTYREWSGLRPAFVISEGS